MRSVYYAVPFIFMHLNAMQPSKPDALSTVQKKTALKTGACKKICLIALPDDVLSNIVSYVIRPVEMNKRRRPADFLAVLEDIARLRFVSKSLCLLVDREKYRFVEYIERLAAHNVRPMLADAARGGHASLMRVLLDKGHMPVDAPIDFSNHNRGDTLSYLAARFGRIDAMELLLRRGTDLSISNHVGREPVHAAVIGGHAHTLDFLLEHKADANARDLCGNTPLHAVTFNRSVPDEAVRNTIQLLIFHGASIRTENDERRTVCVLLRRSGRARLARSVEKARKAHENRMRLLNMLTTLYGTHRPADVITAYLGFDPQRPFRSPRAVHVSLSSM